MRIWAGNLLNNFSKDAIFSKAVIPIFFEAAIPFKILQTFSGPLKEMILK